MNRRRSDFSELRGHLTLLNGQRSAHVDNHTSEQKKVLYWEQEKDRSKVALELIREAALITQSGIEEGVSLLVTRTLEAVFGEGAYEFRLRFVEKRNSTEAEVFFVRGEEEISPMDASGGGAVDVASFGLRLVFWMLRGKGDVLILDEPFRFLSREHLERASEMVKTLADDLGVQVIMVTHSEELAEAGDKVFRVTNRNGISQVEEVGEQ